MKIAAHANHLMRCTRGLFKVRDNQGLTMAEWAGSMSIAFPLVFLVMYAVVEVSCYFAIRANLEAATRRAAQSLVTQFESNGTYANVSNGNLPDNIAFDIPAGFGYYYVRRDANQFTYTWNVPAIPRTVTVTVSLPPGGHDGLLPFPLVDPLKLGSGFTAKTSGTFAVR